jgi:hypothetical protein
MVTPYSASNESPLDFNIRRPFVLNNDINRGGHLRSLNDIRSLEDCIQMNHDMYMNIQEEKSNEIRLNIERLNTADVDRDSDVDQDGDVDAIEELYQSVIVDSLYDSLQTNPVTGGTAQLAKGGKGSNQSMKGKLGEPAREGQTPAKEAVREGDTSPIRKEMMDALRSLGWDLSLPIPPWMRERMNSSIQPVNQSRNNSNNNINNINTSIDNNTENSINMDIGIRKKRVVDKQPKQSKKQSKQPGNQQLQALTKQQMSEDTEARITSPKRKFDDIHDIGFQRHSQSENNSFEDDNDINNRNNDYRDINLSNSSVMSLSNAQITSSTMPVSTTYIPATHDTMTISTQGTMPVSTSGSNISDTQNNDNHDINTFLDVILLCRSNQREHSGLQDYNVINRSHNNTNNHNDNVSTADLIISRKINSNYNNNNNNNNNNDDNNTHDTSNVNHFSRPAPAPLKASKTAGRLSYIYAYVYIYMHMFLYMYTYTYRGICICTYSNI